MAGPAFIKYFPYVIGALKELGNSGTPAEVRDLIAEWLELSDDDINQRMKSGASRFENQVAWARFYLLKAGYLDSSRRGVWSLTEKGVNSNVTDKEALKIFQDVRRTVANEGIEVDNTAHGELENQAAPSESTIVPSLYDHRLQVLELIRQLSPAGFEKLCQRLLREAGFQQVRITGKSGDGGIDGIGVLQINPLLSMQVIFQCKRYQAGSSITSSQIRDLRGAMAGRTDKGIFITTSTFTADAYKESLREGVPPIELVDGEKLVSMLEQLELGLKPRTIYTIDSDFFAEFM